METVEQKKSYWWIWILIIVIVIAVGVYLLLTYRSVGNFDGGGEDDGILPPPALPSDNTSGNGLDNNGDSISPPPLPPTP